MIAVYDFEKLEFSNQMIWNILKMVLSDKII